MATFFTLKRPAKASGPGAGNCFYIFEDSADEWGHRRQRRYRPERGQDPLDIINSNFKKELKASGPSARAVLIEKYAKYAEDYRQRLLKEHGLSSAPVVFINIRRGDPSL